MQRGRGSPAQSRLLASIRYMHSSLKGCSRLASRIFLMTRTLFGHLFHVNRWLAGSWMCLGERGVHTRTGPAAWAQVGPERPTSRQLPSHLEGPR